MPSQVERVKKIIKITSKLPFRTMLTSREMAAALGISVALIGTRLNVDALCNVKTTTTIFGRTKLVFGSKKTIKWLKEQSNA